MIVALWGRDQLAEDSGVEDAGGWGGVTLAHNVGSPAEVDAVIAEAEAAGATIPRHGAETFWGGYSGVFVDPDGHPWEVAHNPHWTIGDDGSITLAKEQTVTWRRGGRGGRSGSASRSGRSPSRRRRRWLPFEPGGFHQRPPARQRPSGEAALLHELDGVPARAGRRREAHPREHDQRRRMS